MARAVADAPSEIHTYGVQEHLNRLAFARIDQIPSGFSGLVTPIPDEVPSRKLLYFSYTALEMLLDLRLTFRSVWKST
jgi:hypothetical protein